MPYLGTPIEKYLRNFYEPQGRVELEYLEGTKYELKECDRCGLIYQVFIPNDAFTARLYERWIDAAKVFDQRKQENLAKHRPEILNELLVLPYILRRSPSSLRVLDFGMGWGEWAQLAQRLGYHVTGSEINTEQTQHARAVGIDVKALDQLVDEAFDYINTEQVFEHVATPRSILHRLVQSLKPSGIIKISVPDSRDAKNRLRVNDWLAGKRSRRSLNSVAPLEHINSFSDPSLSYLAEAEGLLRLWPTYPQYIRWLWSRNIALGVRHPATLLYGLLSPIYRVTLGQGLYYFFRKVSTRQPAGVR